MTESTILMALQRQGFAIVPNVVSPAEAEAMRPLLQREIEADILRWRGKPGYIDEGMVHNLMVRAQPFMQLLDNDVIHEHLSAVLGDTCILYAYTSSSMLPGQTNYSARIHVDSPRLIPGYPTNVGFLVALDDFTAENGATYFLPGSFEQIEPPSEGDFFERATRALPRAGDGILFNARTWHYGGFNTTAVARHAVTMNVCRAYMRQRFDYPRLIAPDLVADASPRLRRFLGFDVRMPTSLDEYYVPADQRLYKGGQG
jgi:ectoine hydroxylase-related dioxygenase (phytanoyl-CoA dioxygenase family)